MIPSKNNEYSESEFWEKRYSSINNNNNNNLTYEWLGDYKLFGNYFRENVVDKSKSILILGCGNSLLSEQLYIDGYKNIHNIDISTSVIQTMSKHCNICMQMKWSIMDCRKMNFSNETLFDIIIDKATLDVFLVNEKSLWNISMDTINTFNIIGNEINRIMRKNSGQFFSITFSAPHFRQPLLEKMFKTSDLKIKNIEQLGNEFHFYLYHLTNDLQLKKSISCFQYEPPIISELKNLNKNDNDNDDDNDFLKRIKL